MSSGDFSITFKGRHDRAPLIGGIFSWLRDVKLAAADGSGVVEDRENFIHSSDWSRFIDEEVLARLGSASVWDPEDLIDCILSGEYLLISLQLSDDQTGILRYAPSAFPFGGTDALKGFLTLYGYSVTGDSFWDEYSHATNGTA